MKTIRPTLCGHCGDQQAKWSFFHQKWTPGGHLEFPIFTKFLSPIPAHMLNLKRICQHLQLVERERKGLWTRHVHIILCNNFNGLKTVEHFRGNILWMDYTSASRSSATGMGLWPTTLMAQARQHRWKHKT
jgi:hypothetical protein